MGGEGGEVKERGLALENEMIAPPKPPRAPRKEQRLQRGASFPRDQEQSEQSRDLLARLR